MDDAWQQAGEPFAPQAILASGGGRHNLGRVLPLDQRNNSVCCQSRAEGNALKHIFHQRNKLGKDIIVTVQELG
ncbi:hypothetical protein [Pseudomonas koreensis]|uniref:hypothetical protein n=1 Tax=Pseudomonas koreensis TaxID=198620 RepID=UPI003F87F798